MSDEREDPASFNRQQRYYDYMERDFDCVQCNRTVTLGETKHGVCERCRKVGRAEVPDLEAELLAWEDTLEAQALELNAETERA